MSSAKETIEQEANYQVPALQRDLRILEMFSSSHRILATAQIYGANGTATGREFFHHLSHCTNADTNSLAAPIRDCTGNITAAINLSVADALFDNDNVRQQLLSLLLDCATKISLSLACRSHG